MDSPPSPSAPQRQGQGSPPRDGAALSPCRCCWDLDYALYEVCLSQGKDGTHQTAERRLVVRFPDVRASAEAGCWTCWVVQSAAQSFWGDEPEAPLTRDDEESLAYLVRDPSTCLGIVRMPRNRLFTNPGAYYQGDYELPRLDVFTESDTGTSPAHPAFAIGASVPGMLTLSRAVETVRRWLGSCQDAHVFCRRTGPTRLPSRVLDVSNVGSVRLVETEGKVDGEYMTLSHCWGSDEATWPTRTTMDNLGARKRGVPDDQLSTLFRDFVNLARELGCHFVWIDSLCIVQDSPEDWARESGKMAHVYSSSLLNVAATSLPNSHHSLFRDRVITATVFERERSAKPLQVHTLRDLVNASSSSSSSSSSPSMAGLRVRRSHQKTHSMVASPEPLYGPDQDYLLSRAWALQERLLAPRTVHFCSSEMVWECRCSYACECLGITTEDRDDGPVSGRRIPTLKHVFFQLQQGTETRQKVYDTWLRVVEEYSTLCLSKPEDRYAAVAGIAEVFGEILDGDNYLAGMWEKDLTRSIGWTGLGYNNDDFERWPRAPSWSWMSVSQDNGSCQAYYSLRLYPDEQLTVRHHHRHPPHPTSRDRGRRFVTPHDGVLEITAWTARCSVHFRYTEADDYTAYLVRTPHCEDEESILIADRPGCAADGLCDGGHYLCLLLGHMERGGWQLLLLRNVPGDTETLYSRVGVFSVPDIDKFKQGAQLQTITLI